MSVELLDNPRFYGYRVRRQVDGKTYQEYFSLKEDGKRLRGVRRTAVKEVAEKRDDELASLQRKSKEKADREIHLDESGQVKGILCRLKKEKSGTMTPVFQVGIMSRVTGKIVNTTVSINKHGIPGAWNKAVDFYCDHKNISRRTKIYKQLIQKCPTKAQVNKFLKNQR